MAATIGVTKVGPSTGICCKNANGGVCRTAAPGVGAVVTAATVLPTGTAAVDRACLRDTANAVSVAGESSGGVAGVFAGIGFIAAVASVVTAAVEAFSVTVLAAWLVARYFPGDVDDDAVGDVEEER